jgi:hypothetical protein
MPFRHHSNNKSAIDGNTDWSYVKLCAASFGSSKEVPAAHNLGVATMTGIASPACGDNELQQEPIR